MLLAIEKEEQFALNIIINFIASLLGHSVNVLFQEEYNVQSYQAKPDLQAVFKLEYEKNILEYSSYFCIENNVMFYKLT